MKYLTLSAAALFLFAAPVAGFAQSDTSGGTGTNAGAGATTDKNTGGSGQAGYTGSQAATGSDSQCNDQTASSGYDSFSEKCRGQIDEWAKGQAGKSEAFEGDLAVGAMVPDSVTMMDVPAYKNYGYVMLNDRRVLVDRSTRKIIKVY